MLSCASLPWSLAACNRQLGSAAPRLWGDPGQREQSWGWGLGLAGEFVQRLGSGQVTQALLAYPRVVGALNLCCLCSAEFLSIIQFAGKLPCEEIGF